MTKITFVCDKCGDDENWDVAHTPPDGWSELKKYDAKYSVLKRHLCCECTEYIFGIVEINQKGWDLSLLGHSDGPYR